MAMEWGFNSLFRDLLSSRNDYSDLLYDSKGRPRETKPNPNTLERFYEPFDSKLKELAEWIDSAIRHFSNPETAQGFEDESSFDFSSPDSNSYGEDGFDETNHDDPAIAKTVDDFFIFNPARNSFRSFIAKNKEQVDKFNSQRPTDRIDQIKTIFLRNYFTADIEAPGKYQNDSANTQAKLEEIDPYLASVVSKLMANAALGMHQSYGGEHYDKSDIALNSVSSNDLSQFALTFVQAEAKEIADASFHFLRDDFQSLSSDDKSKIENNLLASLASLNHLDLRLQDKNYAFSRVKDLENTSDELEANLRSKYLQILSINPSFHLSDEKLELFDRMLADENTSLKDRFSIYKILSKNQFTYTNEIHFILAQKLIDEIDLFDNYDYSIFAAKALGNFDRLDNKSLQDLVNAFGENEEPGLRFTLLKYALDNVADDKQKEKIAQELQRDASIKLRMHDQVSSSKSVVAFDYAPSSMKGQMIAFLQDLGHKQDKLGEDLFKFHCALMKNFVQKHGIENELRHEGVYEDSIIDNGEDWLADRSNLNKFAGDRVFKESAFVAAADALKSVSADSDLLPLIASVFIAAGAKSVETIIQLSKQEPMANDIDKLAIGLHLLANIVMRGDRVVNTYFSRFKDDQDLSLGFIDPMVSKLTSDIESSPPNQYQANVKKFIDFATELYTRDDMRQYQGEVEYYVSNVLWGNEDYFKQEFQEAMSPAKKAMLDSVLRRRAIY